MRLAPASAAMLALVFLLGPSAAGAATSAGASSGPASFQTGFADPLFVSPDGAERERWLGAAAESRASIVRIVASWRRIAPKAPPAGFDGADPASLGYDWAALDAAVRSAAAHGLDVLLDVTAAPAWAEGKDRPEGSEPGSWKPDAAAFGDFAGAIASRYSGHFPDPAAHGSELPRVSRFEVWNEPNLGIYLAPQWNGRKPHSPGLYRELLNSFYAGAKAVQPSATVVAGALAPFGDMPGGERMRPVFFLQKLLCLRGEALKPSRCRRRAHLDALSDHPIAVGPPSQEARHPQDVTTPDLGRLTRVLRRAEATKRVLPPAPKPLWVTEFWYDSNPPDPDGVPVMRQARWYEQALYSFWRQGASVAISLQIVDSPKGRNYALTLQSGVYFLDGSPKPSQTAMRFPFVAHRKSAFEVGIWGIAPARGRVRIEVKRRGEWSVLATARAMGPRRPFQVELRLFRFARLRASQGPLHSLEWAQK